ncbi:helix-turn-helix transcriptional regulator [Actinoplanes solisilvae]|uniref:helix-turn-helix transcriptional regulator n=1 Tax=Actinoplanes solisilvae TaxID=2486853 RepID=UPI0013E34031|nr:LuxR C-terminal-related transcriptional regulator [Actinoplanes solisilvae]
MFDRYHVPLRGRADETREIDQGFTGERAVTVFAGEPGIGKTRLLQYGLQAAEGRGWATMVVTPDADSALTPLGALVDAASRLLTPDDLQTVMRGAAPQYWLTRLLADRLEVAAGRTGILVVVDDLQWLDAGSLSAVTALIHDLQGVPVSWLLATRTGVYSPAHQRFLSRISPVVELPPLDQAAVDAIALDALGGMPGPGVENAIKRAAGSPLLVLELLRGLEEEGLLRPARGLIDIVDDTLPARFGMSARDRLRQVSQDALRICQVGSLYGRDFPLGGVLDIIGRTATEAAPAIQELLDHGFLVDTGTSLAFRHDTVHTAATHSLTPTLRRAMAREVLRRRLHAGEGVATLAATIASVAEAGDDDSLELLFLAANQLASTDMRGAADLAVLGARLTAGHPKHADRVAALLPLVLAGGQVEEAMEISRTLRPLLSADARARAGLAVARQLTESDFDAAITETGAALAIPGISDETRVQLLAVRALNFANKADPAGLLSSLEAARAVADEDRDGLALATIDATSSVLAFNQGHFDAADRLQRQALERVARAGTVAGLWLPEGLWTAFMRTVTGQCSEALRLTDEGVTAARAAHNVIAEAYWMMVRARTLYDLGRLDDARTQSETVLDLGAQLGLGDFANATAGVVLHRIALRTGDISLRDTVRPLIQQLASGVGLTRTGRWSLALEALERGRPSDAHAQAASALASLREPVPSMTTPSDFADDITLAYICRLVDDRASLSLVASVAGERASLNPGNALVSAVATATRGIRDGSAALLLTAAEEVRPVGRPLVTARLLEAAGMLADDDVLALSEALRLFEEHGATRDANRVLHTLRGRGVHKRPKPPEDDPSGLSQRELQVAQRISAGLTTQQIADELLVSPHTVVTYVRHIYAKWGVNSRRGVAEHFARLAGA